MCVSLSLCARVRVVCLCLSVCLCARAFARVFNYVWECMLHKHTKAHAYVRACTHTHACAHAHTHYCFASVFPGDHALLQTPALPRQHTWRQSVSSSPQQRGLVLRPYLCRRSPAMHANTEDEFASSPRDLASNARQEPGITPRREVLLCRIKGFYPFPQGIQGPFSWLFRDTHQAILVSTTAGDCQLFCDFMTEGGQVYCI